MTHWLFVVFNTYVLHPLRADGYQWWSGAGSDLGEVALFAAAWKFVNCQEPGCWRIGHRHPDHGRPVCRKHYHSSRVKPPEPYERD